jgi:hypothetical protein
MILFLLSFCKTGTFLELCYSDIGNKILFTNTIHVNRKCLSTSQYNFTFPAVHRYGVIVNNLL